MMGVWVDDIEMVRVYSFKSYEGGKINRSCDWLDKGGKEREGGGIWETYCEVIYKYYVENFIGYKRKVLFYLWNYILKSYFDYLFCCKL